jgi:peptide/nickel transport system ATP-binding protein
VLLNLLEPTSGEVWFEGENVAAAKGKRLWELHQDMQMIFQDPYSSLNPRMSISETIAEPLQIYSVYESVRELDERVDELMDIVGLARRLYNVYPHELDGGRRQRVGIARALALNPKFIVCDEPVSALDVSIQAQIINLMQDLQEQNHLTYLFITHDLSVVRHIADDVLVMYLGQIVEQCAVEDLFLNQYHPYTKALLSAIALPRVGEQKKRIALKGEIASPINPAPGCRFAPRCMYSVEQCTVKQPQLREVAPGHFVACDFAEEIS